MKKQQEKVDLPPKPKGPAAINLDSSYANPQGPATTRASKASDGTMSVPSCGGSFRKNGAADCDDALSDPTRFDRTPPADAVVVSGRGPAAAARQHSTGRRTGINSKNENDFSKDQTTEDINPVKRSTHKEKK